MKKLSVLGSTGSIGTQTLDIVRKYPERFKACALSCGKNITLLRKQIEEFSPSLVCVSRECDAIALSSEYKKINFVWGEEGLKTCAAESGADMMVAAILGMAGIGPVIAAINAGLDIAFANKETLVAGGALVMDAVRKNGVRFLPVDSEHSAIFQALEGSSGNKVRKLILTASGGPFRGYTAEQLKTVTKEQALKHPNWSMGAKITVDSASMMNKGLEVIEASWLFGISPKDIEVVVHPQSAIHSAVEFEDGSVIAQIASPDMRLPIAYALSYPERLPSPGKSFSFTEIGNMSFEKPNPDVFRCLGLAYRAIELGGSYPVALNSADEEAVAAFLKGQISFTGIADCVEEALCRHKSREILSVGDILDIDKETRQIILDYIKS